ncbi:MAG TPA: hypothetical protein VFJ14_08275 [Nocardioidaceae bacterium]|nr:hypothetical protein [Nocardioidaceae bacterium]
MPTSRGFCLRCGKVQRRGEGRGRSGAASAHPVGAVLLVALAVMVLSLFGAQTVLG